MPSQPLASDHRPRSPNPIRKVQIHLTSLRSDPVRPVTIGAESQNCLPGLGRSLQLPWRRPTRLLLPDVEVCEAPDDELHAKPMTVAVAEAASGAAVVFATSTDGFASTVTRPAGAEVQVRQPLCGVVPGRLAGRLACLAHENVNLLVGSPPGRGYFGEHAMAGRARISSPESGTGGGI
jgi:hypothetical protein